MGTEGGSINYVAKVMTYNHVIAAHDELLWIYENDI